MRFFIGFFLLIVTIGSANAQNALGTATNTVVAPVPSGGMQPLRPPQGTTLSRLLKVGPSDSSPTLREVQNTDRIVYLRTQGPWYEVDLRSADNLEFRGWLKGELPTERTPPPPPPPSVQRAQGPNPLEIEGIAWFWDKKAKEYGSIKFLTGFQNIQYSLSGLNASGARVGVPPGYNFYGWNFSLEGEFIPLQTTVFNRLLYPVLRGSYSFGFHRVSFSNPFPAVPEVAGKGYQINTNTYSLEGLVRLRAFQFQSGSVTLGAGLGFFYHEVAPDLDPISGGSFAGQVVFSDTNFSAMTAPVDLSIRFLNDYYIEPRFVLFLFPDFSENASGTKGIESTGFPFEASATVGWTFSAPWSLEGEIKYLKLSGQAKGAGTRLGNSFTDGAIDLSYQRYTFGVKYSF